MVDLLAPIVLSTDSQRQCVLHAYPNFMSDVDCEILLALAKKQVFLGEGVSASDASLLPEERLCISKYEDRVSQLTNCASHDDEQRATFKITVPPMNRKPRSSSSVFKRVARRCRPRHGSSCSSSSEQNCSSDDNSDEDCSESCRFKNGLHVDTHNGQDHRFVSIILYLNTLTPECGGETVFPHDIVAGASLLKDDITHTAHATEPARESLLAAANRVCETKVSSIVSDEGGHFALVRRCGAGVGVLPRQGLAIVFYTRHSKTGGCVDPASWHGGSSTSFAEKWILQKFKAVPSEKGQPLTEEKIREAASSYTRVPAGC